MRKRTILSALLLLCILFLFVADQGKKKFQANAEDNSDELVDPPKVEDKIDVIPQGLSTDLDVAKKRSGVDLEEIATKQLGEV
ncbi:unnamed protein product [Lathyrus sativus]|nr:unnamed protein product [Lathyrus sativus]